MKCLILMATFNGAKYIDQQIESIINQSFDNWEMIIRDDGSNDGTKEILREFEARENRITVLENASNEQGAYLNFWTLIHYVKKIERYDYYFFADQDDVWLLKKIEHMIDFDLQQKNKEIARLIYADMQVIDGNGELIYPSINEVMGIGEMSGLSLLYSHGFLWGCDILINRRLFDLVPVLPLDNPQISIMSHDNYYGKFALFFGEIKYCQEACIQHRRYDGNKTGPYQIKMTPISALRQAVSKWDDLARTHARVYTQSLVAISQMESIGGQTDEMVKIRKAINSGGLKGTLILRQQKVRRKQMVRTFGIYLIMLLKRYKKYMEI